MVLDLTTNPHQPLLGTVCAILRLREVDLETYDFFLVFSPHEIDPVLCLGLHAGNASVSLNLDAFDAAISFSFDLIDSACCLSQLVL